MKKKGENKVDPYDFSMRKETKHAKSTAKALRPQDMAQGMKDTHGIEKAIQIVKPLTVASFLDNSGNIAAVNTSAGYWTSVLQYLSKGLQNAKSG